MCLPFILHIESGAVGFEKVVRFKIDDARLYCMKSDSEHVGLDGSVLELSPTDVPVRPFSPDWEFPIYESSGGLLGDVGSSGLNSMLSALAESESVDRSSLSGDHQTLFDLICAGYRQYADGIGLSVSCEPRVAFAVREATMSGEVFSDDGSVGSMFDESISFVYFPAESVDVLFQVNIPGFKKEMHDVVVDSPTLVMFPSWASVELSPSSKTDESAHDSHDDHGPAKEEEVVLSNDSYLCGEIAITEADISDDMLLLCG